MRIFKILKRYPSLNTYFNVGDLLYYFPIEDGEYSFKEGVAHIPAKYFCYKKIFHQQKDPFLWKEDVENNPEFFKEIENLYITEDPYPDNAEERMDVIKKTYDNKVDNVISKILTFKWT